MASRAALDLAQQEGLDLVLVSPTATPPVCRIIDYGKFKYEEGKLGKDKKPKQQEVKGIKISPRIAEHDISVSVRKAIAFLEEGSKVRVVCRFMRRELVHPEQGRMKLDLFADRVKDHGTVERVPVLEGNQMTMTVIPKAGPSGKRHAKDQDQQNGLEALQDHRDGEDHAPEVAQQPSVSA